MSDPRFDSRPRASGKRLNVLPDNPDQSPSETVVGPGRFPKWLHRRLPSGDGLWKTQKILSSHRLPTVCEEAKCPNLIECWSQKTATFLAMGSACTRSCGFCDIDFSAKPLPLDEEEPIRLARSVKELGLKHAVITMVARDDLSDGGAAHLGLIIQAVRIENPETTIEVLTSDFQGSESALESVLNYHPEIYNHNIETVRSLTPRVRHRATYERTLNLLRFIRAHGKGVLVKSGLMVGLGEKPEEVKETIHDLFLAGCQIITIGHYLQPSRHKLRVKEFIKPEQFEEYAEYGRSIGVEHVYAGPFVRSSYNAASLYQKILEKKCKL